MITRAFLLLLALLTGLTAAQAGDVARVEQGVAGWSAPNAESPCEATASVQSDDFFTGHAALRIDQLQYEPSAIVDYRAVFIMPTDPVSKSDRLLL